MLITTDFRSNMEVFEEILTILHLLSKHSSHCISHCQLIAMFCSAITYRSFESLHRGTVKMKQASCVFCNIGWPNAKQWNNAETDNSWFIQYCLWYPIRLCVEIKTLFLSLLRNRVIVVCHTTTLEARYSYF